MKQKLYYYETPKANFPATADHILRQTHVLIGGTTGSGKSVLIETLIHRLMLDPPTKTRLVLIDLKRVTFRKYAGLPHVDRLCVTQGEAIQTLRDVHDMMMCRYRELESKGRVQSSDNAVWVIIDEAAELCDGSREVVTILKSILRLGRAANVHIMMATQSPSRKVIPADLTLNFTAQIALRCRSAIESRQVCGYKGAEDLPQYGTALYNCPEFLEPQLMEVQMTPEEETQRIINWWLDSSHYHKATWRERRQAKRAS